MEAELNSEMAYCFHCHEMTAVSPVAINESNVVRAHARQNDDIFFTALKCINSQDIWQNKQTTKQIKGHYIEQTSTELPGNSFGYGPKT